MSDSQMMTDYPGPRRIKIELHQDDGGVWRGRVEQDGALVDDCILKDWSFSAAPGAEYTLSLKPEPRPLPFLRDDYLSDGP